MQASEQQGCEILSSVVPGGRLHKFIHNPTEEGIDEGQAILFGAASAAPSATPTSPAEGPLATVPRRSVPIARLVRDL